MESALVEKLLPAFSSPPALNKLWLQQFVLKMQLLPTAAACNLGHMAVIGRSAAVVGSRGLTGFAADVCSTSSSARRGSGEVQGPVDKGTGRRLAGNAL